VEISVLTGFLAPFLPYLAKTGEDLGEDVARKLGSEAWGFAKRIWARLQPSVDEKEAAQEAVADVAADNGDESALVALDRQLKKLMAADEALAADIEGLLAEARSTDVIASGAGSIAVGGDVVGSTLITGNQNTVER
jgi:hypothetical protein